MNHKIWNVLSIKWNMSIIKSLNLKNQTRFNELKQLVPGISANVLSDRLSQLEKVGLVKKIVTNEQSLQIGYVLHERCEVLKKILIELDEWISSQYDNKSVFDENSTDYEQQKKLFKLLRNEITETEYNFIKDKLLFLTDTKSSDLLTIFNKLKIIIIELFGDDIGNKIINKLNTQFKSI